MDWKNPDGSWRLFDDGVFISMPEACYFSQNRLGSTDLAKLFKEPANWWYSSPFNPNREPRKWVFGNERDFGHGFHYLLLEGEGAYAEKCAISPHENFTTKDAKAWRDEQLGQDITILSPKMDRYIRHMVALVANHPQLAEPMASGLSEVTVLWTDEQGHRLRARFDKLLKGHILDPKSFSALHSGNDDHERALRIVAKLSYDVQRYLYDYAREKLVEFVDAKKVYGGTPREQAWIYSFPSADQERLAERITTYPDGHPDQQSAWSWVWLFLQKPSDSKGHAPVVLPMERPRFDLTWRTGEQKTRRALDNFDHFVAIFGLGDQPNAQGKPAVPWAGVHPLWRPLDEDFPSFMGDISSREHTGNGYGEEDEEE